MQKTVNLHSEKMIQNQLSRTGIPLNKKDIIQLLLPYKHIYKLILVRGDKFPSFSGILLV